MNGFKQCPNGHFYQESLRECPYCQNAGGSIKDNRTVNIDLGSNDSTIPTVTQVAQGAATSTKTQVMGDFGTGAETIPVTPSHQNAGSKSNRTVFGDEVLETGKDGAQQVKFQQRSTRKLVGWLVSYSFDPMGVDFRLFEGRNVIGRDADCNVTVNDGLMSGKHAILLFREGRYKISDNLSSHGTFVNNTDIEDEHFELHDGDVIKLGATVFKFKTSF
ncbi:MAG: FHA domain-containing protein [Paludibacteraceae bacterium]|nr:FHA domain-containing protein [Paludibacteraceae bacterium]